MSNPNVNRNKNTPAQDAHEDASLKGTFVFVMTLGVIIVVSWVSVWSLFISRL